MLRRFFTALWQGITWLRIALANLVFIVLLVMLWLALRSAAPEPLPERAALLLNPRGQVVDELSGPAALSLLGESDAATHEVLLTDLVEAVDAAVDDPRITALLLATDELLYIGQSKASELAAAIGRFRDSGKSVIAVGDYYTQDQYRLAVEADRILLHPLGAVALEGYARYQNYFAEALEKLSVQVHVFRAGDFKSIAEPFMRTDMSPGEKALTERWLGQLWAAFAARVEARRGLADGSVNALLNDYPERLRAAAGDPARLALETGLVDEVLDRQQRREYLAALVGARDEDGAAPMVPFDSYLARVREPPRFGVARIAVVTARGNMLPGDQEPGAIGGDSLARRLRAAAEAQGVRALVLRVDSGGGSVFAAEVIREALAQMRESGLPVVISMGSIAASGGYYIATAADRIVATESTITGSIGVFAAFPTFERLLARGGIHTDGVATTALAGGLRPDRPLDAGIADALQQSVDALYERFVGLVAEGRGLPREQVEAVAEGRVLSAQDALAAGLVDRLGGLDVALAEAAELAGLDDFEPLQVQPQLSPRQQLLRSLSELLGAAVDERLPGLLLGRQVGSGVRDAAQLVDELSADPRHLYMRCLACAGLQAVVGGE
jgi:protease-4